MKDIFKSSLIILVASKMLLASGQCTTPLLTHADNPSEEREFFNVYQCVSKIPSYAIVATPIGTPACTGCIGEVISSVTAVDAYALTSTQVFDVAVLNVTPGCWLLIGNTIFDGAGALGTTNAATIGAIMTISGNTLAGTTYGVNKNIGSPQTTSAGGSGAMMIWPQCVSTATNYYLKADAFFSGGTSFGFGALQAIRVN